MRCFTELQHSVTTKFEAMIERFNNYCGVEIVKQVIMIITILLTLVILIVITMITIYIPIIRIIVISV